MNKNTYAFIGAGNMGGAIIKAVCKTIAPTDVTIFDRDLKKTDELSKQTGCCVALSAEEAVNKAHYIILCVKPKVLPLALRDLAPVLKNSYVSGDKKTVVSIAAGIEVGAIKAVLMESGLELPVIRLMPNTPVAVGKGMILVMPSEDTPEEDITMLNTALSASGAVELFDESIVDAATPVFSCSPAYVYMFIEALADGGVMSGVPRDKAQALAAQAVMGSAAMVLESGKHPGALKDEVCSPGGSTIVGVEELEKAGFRAAVASAVFEAYKKTTQLGK